MLPDVALNVPITRAAQEGNSDNAVKTSNAIAELQEFDKRNEPESPLVSIVCGVLSAIVVVFIVSAVTTIILLLLLHPIILKQLIQKYCNETFIR